MRYVIADIHGCCEAYNRLLKKINFTDKDELYVLGDVVDRGFAPIDLLKDMMMQKRIL